MILITGAAGFIGSAVACALNRKGRTDLLLCDLFGVQEKWKNIAGLNFVECIQPRQLFDYLEQAPHARDISAVIHLGACADTTENDMDFLFENNVQYSVRLCRWAQDHGVRFVYASSAAVYGDGSLGFDDDHELTPRLRPLNKYGFSKWLFDMWVLNQGLGGTVAGLRYFNVFGPNEYHKETMASVVFRTFPQALHQGRIRLFESNREDLAHGEQARDFVYVDEAVAATLFVLESPSVNGIFNAGTGKAHTFNELAEAVFEGMGKEPAVEYFPMPAEIRDRYQNFTRADMSRLSQAGYAVPQDRFREYVVRYVREYLLPGNKYLAEVD